MLVYGLLLPFPFSSSPEPQSMETRHPQAWWVSILQSNISGNTSTETPLSHKMVQSPLKLTMKASPQTQRLLLSEEEFHMYLFLQGSLRVLGCMYANMCVCALVCRDNCHGYFIYYSIMDWLHLEANKGPTARLETISTRCNWFRWERRGYMCVPTSPCHGLQAASRPVTRQGQVPPGNTSDISSWLMRSCASDASAFFFPSDSKLLFDHPPLELSLRLLLLKESRRLSSLCWPAASPHLPSASHSPTTPHLCTHSTVSISFLSAALSG